MSSLHRTAIPSISTTLTITTSNKLLYRIPTTLTPKWLVSSIWSYSKTIILYSRCNPMMALWPLTSHRLVMSGCILWAWPIIQSSITLSTLFWPTDGSAMLLSILILQLPIPMNLWTPMRISLGVVVWYVWLLMSITSSVEVSATLQTKSCSSSKEISMELIMSSIWVSQVAICPIQPPNKLSDYHLSMRAMTIEYTLLPINSMLRATLSCLLPKLFMPLTNNTSSGYNSILLNYWELTTWVVICILLMRSYVGCWGITLMRIRRQRTILRYYQRALLIQQ